MVVAAPATSSVVGVVSVEMEPRFLSFLSTSSFFSFSKNILVTSMFLSSMWFVEKRIVFTSCVYVCVFIYIYIYIYTYIHTHIYIYMCVCVCVWGGVVYIL